MEKDEVLIPSQQKYVQLGLISHTMAIAIIIMVNLQGHLSAVLLM